jgi:hypothetical protein
MAQPSTATELAKYGPRRHAVVALVIFVSTKLERRPFSKD